MTYNYQLPVHVGKAVCEFPTQTGFEHTCYVPVAIMLDWTSGQGLFRDRTGLLFFSNGWRVFLDILIFHDRWSGN